MENVIVSIVTALGISLIAFASKVQSGESFNVMKVVRTVIVGIVIGYLVFEQGGIKITHENWETLLAANAGIITVVDRIVNAVWKLIPKKKEA